MPSPKNTPKKKPRRRIIRNEEEKSALNQIASFFDERDKAYSLLYRNINNGFIRTPDNDMTIQDFLKIHQEAWQKRKESRTPNSLEFLRSSMVTWAQTSTSFGRPIKEPDLDG